MNNYPDGMDWAAYDDCHDPKLECGHSSGDDCDCWCPGGEGNPHLVDHCGADNCSYLQCTHCGTEVENEDAEEISCQECIAEAGCQCNDPDCRVWIHCSIGIARPAPATFAIERKFAHTHWTLSPTNFDLEKRKETTVEGVQCSSCKLAVNL
jgi:hypothetical protein